MTQNQIEYNKLLETKRHNVASLNETIRSNQVREVETERHNRATEAETGRHNLVTEANQVYDTQMRTAASRYAADVSASATRYAANKSAQASMYSANKAYESSKLNTFAQLDIAKKKRDTDIAITGFKETQSNARNAQNNTTNLLIQASRADTENRKAIANALGGIAAGAAKFAGGVK